MDLEKLIERFIRYAKVNTQSDERSSTVPSSRGQLELAAMVAEELIIAGMEDAEVDGNGYVMASLKENTKQKLPVIGFIAHLDTSPDFRSDTVNPQLVHYAGKSLILNKKENITLSPLEFPVLNNYIGQTLITTDGNSLLGADNKAGVAEIVTAMEYLVKHPEIEHGPIRIAFTPDEEIGRGADHFDVARFGASFAYTVDGGGLGELEYENFNAAKAKISIQGLNVHPGSAKNKMKNSMRIAMELNSMLPASEVPEHTEGYEGFFHLNEFDGNVDQTVMQYIIRDHDQQLFNRKKDLLIRIVDHLNMKYGARTVTLIMVDQYYNMREKIEQVPHLIELARQAISECGVIPRVVPIRGGTDGARLSFMGLPCPNLFTGGHNYHSRYEFVPVKSMQKAAEVIVRIAALHAKQAN